jgi:hypothetical protein
MVEDSGVAVGRQCWADGGVGSAPLVDDGGSHGSKGLAPLVLHALARSGKAPLTGRAVPTRLVRVTQTGDEGEVRRGGTTLVVAVVINDCNRFKRPEANMMLRVLSRSNKHVPEQLIQPARSTQHHTLRGHSVMQMTLNSQRRVPSYPSHAAAVPADIYCPSGCEWRKVAKPSPVPHE